MSGIETRRRGEVPRWTRELLGWAVAAAVAITAVAVVAASPRSELLFRDGDSLVTTLVVHSLAIGQPQDWAMSSVLFLPEIAVLWMLSLLGLGINGTLALAGVVNVLALYGALRVAAGSARTRAPIAGALLALAGFALLAATEGSPSRDALELASLLTTTTYYSATVVAVVLAVGLARRALDRPDVSRGTPAARGLVAALALVAAASVLTNPLFAAWATVPLGAVLVIVALRRPDAWWPAGALVAGSVIGYLARMPLAHLIANTGAGYIDPSQWLASLDYYGALLADRWREPWGAASILLLVLLWAWSIVATVLLARRGTSGAAVVAACGWVIPLLVIVGAVALGTHAARYLQPAVFAPLLALTVVPGLLPDRIPVTRLMPAVGAAALALVAAVGLGIPSLVTAATSPDTDLDCVVRWAEQSGRTGAGQFWTVRLPKTHLADPRGLVQVDHQLRGYAWLVNRDDFAVGEVTFLVMDAQSPAFELPAGVSPSDAELTSCGRYTIADFGDLLLPIGPQRS
ncbi:hypothetical protein [Microbacterium jejuense]|uniref:hypothetical protein n=1 Tax=Microbacterium jejuense TaxID=1263637 RepID=UPI0031E5B613